MDTGRPTAKAPRRARRAAAPLALLAALAVTGACGSTPEPAADAVPAPWTGCDPSAVAGRIPADFEPVTAYLCAPSPTVPNAPPSPPPAPDQRLEGDLGPLLDALNAPDDRRSFGPCTTELVVGPSIWLVDAHDNAILAVHPVDGCGKPKRDEITNALAALTADGRG